MHLPDQTRIIRALSNLVIAVSALIVVMALYIQLQRPAEGDSGFLNYFAWLFREKHFIPYKDAFDTSFPMTLLFHMAVTAIGGYSDAGFQAVNVLMLCILMVLTWGIVARISKQTAIITALTFVIIYSWENVQLGREFQCLFWLVCAIRSVLATSLSLRTRIILASIFLGIAASVKPHFIVTALPLIWYVTQQEKLSFRKTLRLLPVAIITGSIVIAIPFVWLWYKGGLDGFIDIFTGYLPLYLELSGASDVVTTQERLSFMLVEWWHMSRYVIPLAGVGMYIFLNQQHDDDKRRLGIFFLLEAITCNLYIVPAGKFWIFQMMPYFYFSVLVISLGFGSSNRNIISSCLTAGLMIFIAVLNANLGYFIYHKRIALFSDEVGEYLSSKNITDSERVQIWQYNTDGIRGFLNARVITATPHMTYEPFYHHLSNRYTIRLKQEFMQQLQASNPRWLIRERRLFIPRGDDTNNRFEAFDTYIKDHYTVDKESEYYTFYIRKD